MPWSRGVLAPGLFYLGRQGARAEAGRKGAIPFCSAPAASSQSSRTKVVGPMVMRLPSVALKRT